MKNTAAFLVLLGCLTGSAVGETQAVAPQQQRDTATTDQNCTGATSDPAPQQMDPSAPQNQVEYGGGG